MSRMARHHEDAAWYPWIHGNDCLLDLNNAGRMCMQNLLSSVTLGDCILALIEEDSFLCNGKTSILIHGHYLGLLVLVVEKVPSQYHSNIWCVPLLLSALQPWYLRLPD